MDQQLSLDAPEQGPGVLVVLLRLRSRDVHRELVKVVEDGPTNLFVRGFPGQRFGGVRPATLGMVPRGDVPRCSSSAIRRLAQVLMSAKRLSSS